MISVNLTDFLQNEMIIRDTTDGPALISPERFLLYFLFYFLLKVIIVATENDMTDYSFYIYFH